MFFRLDLNRARTILTGASSGIGRALAEQLSAQGARLVLASRDRSRLEEVATQLRHKDGEAHVVPTDVTDPTQRANLVGEAVRLLGGLDVLINNAGVGAMGYFADESEALLRRIFEVNFFSATELTRLALPHLRQGRNALLVNVSSVLGRRALAGCSEYCASKFAVTGWSEGLRPELAQQGIHVLLVCPGVIQTNFKDNLIENRLRFWWLENRAMSAEECARLIVRAMRRKKNELVTTLEGKAVLWLNRLAPRLLDYGVKKFARPRKDLAPADAPEANKVQEGGNVGSM